VKTYDTIDKLLATLMALQDQDDNVLYFDPVYKDPKVLSLYNPGQVDLYRDASLTLQDLLPAIPRIDERARLSLLLETIQQGELSYFGPACYGTARDVLYLAGFVEACRGLGTVDDTVAGTTVAINLFSWYFPDFRRSTRVLLQRR
jgi:hypothetical protein